MTLAVGRFESNLRAYLKLRSVSVSKQAAFGSLISKLDKHCLLSENGVQVLRTLKRQRNYLTHSLFDLFSTRVDEILLPRTDLVLKDVSLFVEKVRELEQNISGLSRIVEERITGMDKQAISKPEAYDLLFRP